ncbi:MAG: peptide deformylase, partial [Bdellovibrionota bacterium]
LIEDMIETMHEYSGIGLAAPQVHHSLQLALIEFSEDSSRYPDMGERPLQILINPRTTVLDESEQGYWEGCLSVPELRGLVQRPRKIQVDYLDRSGKPKTIVAEGFLATVFQHELDHLDGVLYVDKIRDKTKFAFIEEYQRYWAPDEDSDEGELED